MIAQAAQPNFNKLQTALGLYRAEFRRFVIAHLEEAGEPGLRERLLQSAGTNQHVRDKRAAALDRGVPPLDVIDIGDFPHLIRFYWSEIFERLAQADENFRFKAQLIAAGRNEWAHPPSDDMAFGTTITYLDNIRGLLHTIGATESAKQVADMVASYERPAPIAPEPPSGTVQRSMTSGSSVEGLKPWREVAIPHIDVLNGDMTMATFAADLQQVASGKAVSTEYGNPVEFFRRSHITDGLKELLVNAVRRVNAQGGDPVVQLKTVFGGGKTHSLIALYHLISNDDYSLSSIAADESDETGSKMREIYENAGIDPSNTAEAKVAVLAGTFSSQMGSETTKSGDPLNTLWGNLAYQIGEQAAYDLIGEYSRKWVSPAGEQLDELFDRFGPCAILIDELALHMGNLDRDQSKKVEFFLQALTESAARSSNVVVVVTIPVSPGETEESDDVANEAKIEALINRIDAPSIPLGTHDSSEVVRLRMFSGIEDPIARDATCEAYSQVYSGRNRNEFPTHATRTSYVDLMKRSYPFHPEVFERLRVDWSTISDFQLTRGMLRLIAGVIKRLYGESDAPLIMPGDLPLHDRQFANELLRVLSGNWDPVVSEFAEPNSTADEIDLGSIRYADCRPGAAKRIARTIFLGSVPSKSRPGLDRQEINLGTVQPRQNLSVYRDALGELEGKLHFLHVVDGRYVLRTEPNLNRLHHDLVGKIDDLTADARIEGMFSSAIKKSVAGIEKNIEIVGLVSDSNQVADDRATVKLVALAPAYTLPSRDAEDDTARPLAASIVLQRGQLPRHFMNTITFLVASRDEVRKLRTAVRALMAWEDILDNAGRFGVPASQINGIKRQIHEARLETETRLARAYRRILTPVRANPAEESVELTEVRVDVDGRGEIFESAVRTLESEFIVVFDLSTTALKNLVEEHFWNATTESADVDHMREQLARFLGFIRLAGPQVLDAAVSAARREGVYDVKTGADPDDVGDQPTYLVPPVKTGGITGIDDPPGPDTLPDPPPHMRHKRVRIRKTEITSGGLLRFCTDLSDEVLQALDASGASISISVSIDGEIPDGLDDIKIAELKENAQHLGMQVEFPI